MTDLAALDARTLDLSALASLEGRIAVIVAGDGKLDAAGRRVNRLARGAVERAAASADFARLDAGGVMSLPFAAGLAAEAVDLVKLDKRADVVTARRAGAAVAQRAGGAAVHLLAGTRRDVGALSLGLLLRGYAFTARKTGTQTGPGAITLHVADPEAAAPLIASARALAEGVCFTRDLVNEPSNVLTTSEFALRLEDLRELGIEVEVLEEDELEDWACARCWPWGRGRKARRRSS